LRGNRERTDVPRRVPALQAADVSFQETVKPLSHKLLAERIARSLFERAREGIRRSEDVPAAFHGESLAHTSYV
jgi:hypothetical protein